MKEVTKEEYHKFIGDKNLAYSIENDYFPYTGLWKTRYGKVVAKSVPIGKHIGTNRDKYKYYIYSN